MKEEVPHAHQHVGLGRTRLPVLSHARVAQVADTKMPAAKPRAQNVWLAQSWTARAVQLQHAKAVAKASFRTSRSSRCASCALRACTVVMKEGTPHAHCHVLLGRTPLPVLSRVRVVRVADTKMPPGKPRAQNA